MDKKGVLAIVASKAADEEVLVLVQTPVEASHSAVVPIMVPVPANGVAAGEEAPVGRGKVPLGWDPYEEQEYIYPENPYDTSLIDPWSEVDSSDICSDDESKHTKTRQVPRRLKSSQYDHYFADDVYRCPFCERKLHATDFNCIVKHAENWTTCVHNVNVHAFRAKHKALGFHLCNLQKVAIKEGRIPPIKPKDQNVKGMGNKKWRKCQREEAEARRCR